MKIGKVIRYDEPRPVHLAIRIPQNNLPIVLYRRKALEEMCNHAADETHHEVGGYLLGFPIKDVETATEATYIEKAVRAIYNSTPTYVTMHPESFKEVESIREQDDTILVGYYHSHPGLGIFLSGIDVKNFRDYHAESYKIAVVVDPSKMTLKHLDAGSEGIGFFGWDRNSTPIKLPAENVILVENRPEVMSIMERKPMVKLENEIANAIWQASDMLRQEASHRFDPKVPIVIISKDVRELLLRKVSNYPNEGLLYGDVGHIAGYDFICVAGFRPLGLDVLPEYNEYIRKLRKKFPDRSIQSYAMPIATKEMYRKGIQTIGLYCIESKISQFDIGTRKNKFFTWKETNLRDFARYCGKYCLIAVKNIDGGEARISFKAWCIEEKRLIELPESQVVIKQGGGNG